MIERGGGAGFVFEAVELLVVEHCRERQHLQRDAAAEGDLLRLVHDAHAAAANFAEDTEIAQRAVGCVFARCCGCVRRILLQAQAHKGLDRREQTTQLVFVIRMRCHEGVEIERAARREPVVHFVRQPD
jgi:hypothetical protein